MKTVGLEGLDGVPNLSNFIEGTKQTIEDWIEISTGAPNWLTHTRKACVNFANYVIFHWKPFWKFRDLYRIF